MQVPTEVDCVWRAYILDNGIKDIQCRQLARRWNLRMVRMPTQRQVIVKFKGVRAVDGSVQMTIDAQIKKREIDGTHSLDVIL